MIIIFSNSLDVTTDYVCARLKSDCVAYVRLNTDELTQEIELLYKNHDFSLCIDRQILNPSQVSSVWYRRPQSLKLKSEQVIDNGNEAHTVSEWNASIEGFLSHISSNLWINHPSNNALALSKLEQLNRANRLGLTTPRTLVTQSFDQVFEFWKECNEKLIVKPISHGYIERENPEEDTLIFTNEVTLNHLKENKQILALCPTLFQEKIEKIYDIRVNVIDNELVSVAIYASEEDKLQGVDIRRNNMQNVRYEIIALPSNLKNKILAICHSYSLRFASVDMAFTNDLRYVFFEINPNGQWAWLDLEGVTDIAHLLIKSMQTKIS